MRRCQPRSVNQLANKQRNTVFRRWARSKIYFHKEIVMSREENKNRNKRFEVYALVIRELPGEKIGAQPNCNN